ncbi:phosphomannomutase [Kosakonia sp.]|uniref:phosphomannomutase n=1 Tax=Kosakonia sp. TaxID=1916651 RepID=UPI0028A1A1EC|nr:phosphomannomutase [Kosakonia sp.]
MESLLSSNIIKNSNIAFGTSGARGLVRDFTPEVCAAFTVNFLQVISSRFTASRVAIAIDNRPSSYAMAQACAVAAQSLGYQVMYFGVTPTPALAFYAMQQQIPAIMITGSHIPFDRNGLKFYRPDGEISKDDELAILRIDVKVEMPARLPVLHATTEANEQYIHRYLSIFDNGALKGMRIGIYEHSSAGRDIYPAIFSGLGADVIRIGRSDEFVPIDTEAVSEEDKARALEWVAQYQLDALFSTDGDGDRPLLSDENGIWLRGDILCFLCSLHLDIDVVAIPVSCNSAIAESKLFKHVELTKIGSPYIIESFEQLTKTYNRVAGFEANGGYLLGSDIIYSGATLKALPTRDAVLPALVLLISSIKRKISDQVQALPARFTASDRLQNFAKEKSTMLLDMITSQPEDSLTFLGLGASRIVCVNMLDGIRMVLNTGDIVHLRPSGNAPELRCYSESDSALKAAQLVALCLKNIHEKL